MVMTERLLKILVVEDGRAFITYLTSFEDLKDDEHELLESLIIERVAGS